MTNHKCNAYCEGDLHVTVFSTPDNPPMFLFPGVTFVKGGRWVEVTKVEVASPEFADRTAPAGYIYTWLGWWRYV